jgi:hypothetical protein
MLTWFIDAASRGRETCNLSTMCLHGLEIIFQTLDLGEGQWFLVIMAQCKLRPPLKCLEGQHLDSLNLSVHVHFYYLNVASKIML